MKNKIKNFIAELTFTDVTSFDDDTLIFDEGIMDSMGLLGLINFLEEEFGVITNDLELHEDNFGSVERIAGFISRKIALVS